MRINIKLLNNRGVIPQKAHYTDAAYDLVVPKETTIISGRQVIPLDFAMELPLGYCAEIQPRSGISSKGLLGHNVDILYGLIDSGYRGNIGVIINNHDCSFSLPQNTRIAQMIIRKVETADFAIVQSLSESDRLGGFGSSGI